MATGGTDTHLMTADPAPFGVDARTARGRLAAAGLVLDTCALPARRTRADCASAGCLTTQGMGETEMVRIAGLSAGVLRTAGKASSTRRSAGTGGQISAVSALGRGRCIRHSITCNHRRYPDVPNHMRASLVCGAEMASETCGGARA